jgi:hypothetical protein
MQLPSTDITTARFTIEAVAMPVSVGHADYDHQRLDGKHQDIVKNPSVIAAVSWPSTPANSRYIMSTVILQIQNCAISKQFV